MLHRLGRSRLCTFHRKNCYLRPLQCISLSRGHVSWQRPGQNLPLLAGKAFPGIPLLPAAWQSQTPARKRAEQTRAPKFPPFSRPGTANLCALEGREPKGFPPTRAGGEVHQMCHKICFQPGLTRGLVCLLHRLLRWHAVCVAPSAIRLLTPGLPTRPSFGSNRPRPQKKGRFLAEN